MNRRLHNSFLALSASGAMLVLAAMAGAPAIDETAPGMAVAAASAPAPDRAQASLETTVRDAVERAIDEHRPARAHRTRRAVIVPYFSFARG